MFASPKEIIAALELSPDQIVVDFGAGSGAMTLAVAEALNGTGRIYAIEVQKDVLTRLENTCKEHGASNVAAVWGDIEKPGGTKLREQIADVVIVSNVLFQAPNKSGVIEEAKRLLKTNGKLLVIDWTASFKNLGPTEDQVFKEGEVRQLALPLGFSFIKAVDAGHFHYGLLFRKGLYYNPNASERSAAQM